MEKKWHFLDEITSTVLSPDCRARKPGEQWTIIGIHHTDVGGRDVDSIDNSTWHKLHKNIVGWLTKKDDVYVSAHFQIGRFGECTMMVDPRTHVAYHAGVSAAFHYPSRKVRQGCNEFTVGVELLGDGNKGVYSDQQYERLIKLTRALREDFPSLKDGGRGLKGHDELSPGRKVDPGKYFDWERYCVGVFALN